MQSVEVRENLLALGFSEEKLAPATYYRNGLIFVKTLAVEGQYSVKADAIQVDEQFGGSELTTALGHFLREQASLNASVTEFAAKVATILAEKGLATSPKLEKSSPSVIFFAAESKVPLFQLIFRTGGEYDINMETGFHIVSPDEVASSVALRWTPTDDYFVSQDRMVIKTLEPACDFIKICIDCGVNSIRHYYAKTWMTAGDEGMRHLLPRETNTVQVLEIILKNPLP